MLAGTAPGHDAVDDYELVMRAARGVDIEILDERRPLELADHIRRARVVIGTSLHARIVAAAYGVPRVSLAKPKPTRYAKHWDPDMPFDVTLEGLDAAIAAAIQRAGRARGRRARPTAGRSPRTRTSSGSRGSSWGRATPPGSGSGWRAATTTSSARSPATSPRRRASSRGSGTTPNGCGRRVPRRLFRLSGLTKST